MVTNISSVFINASLDRVWNALTKPEKVKLWQYGSDSITTWEVGSKIEFVTEWEGQIFKQWGKVLEMKQNEVIKYSLFAPSLNIEDRPENYFIMKYVLTPKNGQTKLEIIKEDNRPNAVQEESQGEENPILQSLKNIVETSS
jgi:uncharacterized protein YndB with AHSA1/START domain